MQRGRFIELIVAQESKGATFVEGVIVICTSTTYCPLGDNIKANKQRSLVCWPLQHQLGRRTTKTGATINATLPPFSKTKPISQSQHHFHNRCDHVHNPRPCYSQGHWHIHHQRPQWWKEYSRCKECDPDSSLSLQFKKWETYFFMEWKTKDLLLSMGSVLLKIILNVIFFVFRWYIP